VCADHAMEEGSEKTACRKRTFLILQREEAGIKGNAGTGIEVEGQWQDAKVRRINNAVHASHTTCT
jgi:hypothetical protein